MATGPLRRCSNAAEAAATASTAGDQPTAPTALRVAFAIVPAIDFQLHFASIARSATRRQIYFRNQFDIKAPPHLAPRHLHQLAHIVRFGAAEIDDEIGVALRRSALGRYDCLSGPPLRSVCRRNRPADCETSSPSWDSPTAGCFSVCPPVHALWHLPSPLLPGAIATHTRVTTMPAGRCESR